MRYGGFGPGGSSGTTSSSSYSTSRDFESSSFGSSSMGAGGSSSNYRRSSSGVGGAAAHAAAADISAAAAVGGGGGDPVEATRARIARLKAEGALPGAADGDSPVGPGFEPGADGLSPKKGPKKLSEIKINPAISATFAKGGLAPPPSSSSGVKFTSQNGGAAAAPSSGIDLLGDLTDVPAAAAKASADDWDGFASAAVAAPSAAAGGDEWAAFDSAPPAVGSQVRLGLECCLWVCGFVGLEECVGLEHVNLHGDLGVGVYDVAWTMHKHAFLLRLLPPSWLPLIATLILACLLHPSLTGCLSPCLCPAALQQASP